MRAKSPEPWRFKVTPVEKEVCTNAVAGFLSIKTHQRWPQPADSKRIKLKWPGLLLYKNSGEQDNVSTPV